MRVNDLRFRFSRRLGRGVPHDRYVRAGARLVEGRSADRYLYERPALDDLAVWERNQQLVLDLARESGVEPFFVDAPEGEAAVVGLSSQEMDSFLRTVASASQQRPLQVVARFDDGSERIGLAVQELRGDLTGVQRLALFENYRDTLTGRQFARRHACTVERWARTDDDSLVAPALNGRASSIPGQAQATRVDVSVHGTALRTFPGLLEPQPFEVDFPVDVVYLWVDGDDPEWRRRRAARLRSVGSEPDAASLEAVRFEQGDELRYSLRSLERYAPWVRRIHVVTDQQRPTWLAEVPGRLEVVDHREILPAEDLPTYNSHAITAAVHRIPGLTSRFLLLNDDVLLGRPVRAETFFFSNGATKFFPSRSALPLSSPEQEESPLVGARRRSQALIDELTGRRPNFGFKHTPVAFNRDLLAELEQELPQWRDTLASPFRSAQDIVPSWLHHYLGYDRGLCFPGEIKYSYFDIGDPRAVRRLRSALRKERPHALCVNDVTPELIDGVSRHEALCEILEAALPWASSFENDQAGAHAAP